MSFKVAIGSDHAGFELKEKVRTYLAEKGNIAIDFGAFNAESSDYPDFAHPVSEAVEKGSAELGVLVCGSGIGVSITANKHAGVRAALCWTEEIAALSRQHNNANVLCLPARFIETEKAFSIIDTFLANTFEGGRHARRVGKINC